MGRPKIGHALQEAKPGTKVSVRYKGWLAKNNKVFDQTKGSKTFNFRVGAASARSPADAELPATQSQLPSICASTI